ncbi:peptidyl-dipeptidase Dcp [Microbacterium barkeri]|uniref:Peptidyl-dipeptidase Dcp n=1 Tax=Microbacterium barkeri TaxID=33917 RepID=A0A9W6LVL1_9MICO|nr:M3 family metallopeptidase [Microbacterium barkeri]MDR6876181.1 peptidyl-dipeptidase Dcp [Microbacterium barkeri]GLJ60298.1 peptidyl-dipeptidase Dcp [Microbacterium barkeri]
MTAPVFNPLLAPSPLPYGLPDYAAIEPGHYLPAFERAFAEHRAEIDAITANPDAPTFENTLEPLERSGALLDAVSRAFYTVNSAHATAEIQEIDEQLAPLMSAHSDAIELDAALYARIGSVRDRLDELDLTAEQRRLVERRHTEMTRAGAALDDTAKERLTELNARLSTLTTRFEKNLLADTNDLAVVFDSAEELEGLAPGELSAAAEAARERGLDGRYAVTLTLFTGHPHLSSLVRRDARERILAASRARASRGNANDSSEVVREIVRLRAERAALLGYPSHAAYVTSDETAGSPEAVRALLRRLAGPAARNAQREKAALQRIVDETEPEPFPLAAHDWAFYTEKVRQAEYDIDTAALRPWFEAERVLRDGVFHAAQELYGLDFRERADLPSYHPDVRAFEVLDSDGTPLGLYLLDLYTRDTKRGGAWMNSLVAQSALRGTKPVVVNNLNVVKPAAGEPTLLTLDNVTTLFHEFGHALHGLFARVTYPHFAGTAVHRDFVEFPSQVNEMWILWPEVLANYAVHHETGEPLPADVVERLRASETFNQGFETSEYLAAAWLDQAWHALSPSEAAAVTDVAAFEAAALADIGLDEPTVPTRYSSTYFQHIFAGGYSAGYYSYIWAEVLDADTVEWFRENGGLSRAGGDRFRARLLGVGGAKDPLEAYRDFRGRDAEIAPLLKRRGLDA